MGTKLIVSGLILLLFGAYPAFCQVDVTNGINTSGIQQAPHTVDPQQYKSPEAARPPTRSAIKTQAQAEAGPVFLSSIGVDKIDAEHATLLRQRAAYLIADIRELAGEFDDGSYDQMRRDAGELADIEKQLQNLIRNTEEARRRQESYLQSLPTESTHHSQYAVNTSDSTAHHEEHCEEYVSYSSISITKSAGFDSAGNPLKTNGYELIPHKTVECK